MSDADASHAELVNQSDPDKFVRVVVLLLIVAIFLAACASPAIGDRHGTMPGIACLFLGLTPIVPPWLANPVFFFGCLCFFLRRYTPSIILSVIAVMLGSMTKEFIGDDDLFVGFYLWLSAPTVLLVGSTVLRMRATPRFRFSVRALMAAVAASAVVVFGSMRVYRQVIPRGANFYQYQLASFDGPTLVSPDGRRSVQVMFNDAGAAHSGFHWTWLIVGDWTTGRYVVAEGYRPTTLRPGDGSFPARWIDDQTFEVEFVAGRNDQTPVKETVHLR